MFAAKNWETDFRKYYAPRLVARGASGTTGVTEAQGALSGICEKLGCANDTGHGMPGRVRRPLRRPPGQLDEDCLYGAVLPFEVVEGSAMSMH